MVIVTNIIIYYYMIMEKVRCPWCAGDELYIKYHDEEWGVPLKDSKKLFEFLILDGAQAGLSWITILKRRDGYRAAFDNMEPESIAHWTNKDIERVMLDSRIIRNKMKIESVVRNAKSYLKMADRGIDFSNWLWDWVDGKPIVNNFKTLDEVPASTPLSEKICRELKSKGFNFVGPTIIYAFMQAAGLVNDHLTSCCRHDEIIRSGLPI